MEPVTTRFAPSNTGLIYLGNLRTGIFSYFLARQNEGTFYLRIDDTDSKRSDIKYSQEIKDILKIFQISNCGIYYQSERKIIYDIAFEQLLASNDIYKDGDVYKFKIDNSDLSYYDELLKKEIIINKEIADIIVRRSDGSYLFNFCCAVDDSVMGISHVIRGSDHINNTIIQLQIIKRLGYPTIPKYISSLGLIKELSSDGQYSLMSKRDGSSSVRHYLERGYYPEAILNCIMRLGCSFGTDEFLPTWQLCENFSINGLNSNSSYFDITKLNSYQSTCIQREEVFDLLNEFNKMNKHELFKEYLDDYVEYSEDKLKLIISLYQNRLTTLEDLGILQYIFKNNWKLEISIIKSISGIVIDKVLYYLEEFKNTYIDHDQATIDLKKLVKDVSTELKLPSKEIYLDLRKCLTGNETSPDLQKIVNILGIDEVLKRLHNCNDYFYEIN